MELWDKLNEPLHGMHIGWYLAQNKHSTNDMLLACVCICTCVCTYVTMHLYIYRHV